MGIRIIGIKEFTEVPLSHLYEWTQQQPCASERRARLHKVVFHPFLAPIKEDFAFVGVEFARNEDRAADVVAELVVVNGGGESGCGVRIPSAGIRVQGS